MVRSILSHWLANYRFARIHGLAVAPWQHSDYLSLSGGILDAGACTTLYPIVRYSVVRDARAVSRCPTHPSPPPVQPRQTWVMHSAGQGRCRACTSAASAVRCGALGA